MLETSGTRSSGIALELVESHKAGRRLVDSWWAMTVGLQSVLETLRAHESELRRLGCHTPRCSVR